MAAKRKPAYEAFIVLGIAFIALAFTTNIAFLGVGIVFIILGVGAKKRQGNADG